ncbi:YihY/virulence factor BrkB family protein [Echinicola jeungdonensis]|uniref:YihY/virulence factor BrkB family protein n=1 Tax=Echinicola jeungdonensis TaxID=709343 RepID=A0ABV5J3Q8_9BACT|nr:YihY/virulence factor BrkB family protein [Echinicola jeungdonensis]MDN3668459.1 YihY/virulence factor BrkB family protein [Echinicola jeungdonensis]
MVKKHLPGILDLVDKQAQKLRHIHFGNRDQNIYDVGKIFIHQLKKDEIDDRAYAVAFNFTVAMFPLLLFLLNTLPFIEFLFPEVTTDNILLFIKEVMPPSLYSGTEATILDIISRPRQGLLSFGFLLALYLATNGTVSLINAFNACYRTKDTRGFLETRAFAVLINFVLILDICAAVLVMILGSKALLLLTEYGVVSNNFLYFLVALLRFFALLFLFMMATSFIFRFAPAVHDKWRFFSTGSVTAGLLITIAFYLFSYYLNNFASYNKLYGSIGTMIALMFWLLITSFIILICFEINVSLDKAAERKNVSKFINR